MVEIELLRDKASPCGSCVPMQKIFIVCTRRTTFPWTPTPPPHRHLIYVDTTLFCFGVAAASASSLFVFLVRVCNPCGYVFPRRSGANPKQLMVVNKIWENPFRRRDSLCHVLHLCHTFTFECTSGLYPAYNQLVRSKSCVSPCSVSKWPPFL